MFLIQANINSALMFQNWTTFSPQPYNLLSEGFCHDRLFRFEFTNQVKDQSSITVKQVVQFPNGKATIQDDLGFYFKFPTNQKLFTRFKVNHNYFKIHYELDLPLNLDFKNKWNVYSTFVSDLNFRNASFRVGAQVSNEEMTLNSRLKALLFDQKTDATLYNKFTFKRGFFSYQFLSAFNFTFKHFYKNDLLLGFKLNQKHQAFLRAEVDGFRNYTIKFKDFKSYFDFLIADYVYTLNENNKFCIQIKYQVFERKIKSYEMVFEKQFEEKKKIKVKINQNADISMLYQSPSSISNGSFYSFGIQIAEILKSRKISYGFGVKLNFEDESQ